MNKTTTECCGECKALGGHMTPKGWVCGNPACKCHSPSKEGWEKQFDERWYLHTKHSTYKAGEYAFTTVGEEVKSFISQRIAKAYEEGEQWGIKRGLLRCGDNGHNGVYGKGIAEGRTQTLTEILEKTKEIARGYEISRTATHALDDLATYIKRELEK